jgi:hypothetical protein
MHGTLVGVFVTVVGIVVGVDSAVTGPGVPFGTTVQKYCEISDSVATIQGKYAFPIVEDAQAPLLERFHATCDELRESVPRITIDQEADLLIERLQNDLADYLRALRSKNQPFEPPFGRDPHIVYVMVAGYEHGMPFVAVRELTVRRRESQWETIIANVPALNPLTSTHFCGLRFQGEIRPIIYLLKTPSAFGTPETPDTISAREMFAGRCALTPEGAKRFFVSAVQTIILHGSVFGIPAGSVGGPLQLDEIRADGQIVRQTIEHYLTREP